MNSVFCLILFSGYDRDALVYFFKYLVDFFVLSIVDRNKMR